MSLLPVKRREEPRLSDDPRNFVSLFFRDRRILKVDSTLVGACWTLVGACSTSFPSASYTIGLASSFALHTLRRIVVFPAFALPMMRMRN